MENISGGFGGLSDTKHSPSQLTVPTEAQETTKWWQTQNIQRGGTGGCENVLNGQMFFTIPSPYQHRI